MNLKKIFNEIKNVNLKDVTKAIYENFTYGFLGASIVSFITLRIDLAVFIGYLSYYLFLSKVINRPKYVTDLGKFILFPVPTTIGAFIGYKIAFLIDGLLS